MSDAARDGNQVPALTAVSSSDNSTIVRLQANPTTHRLLTDDIGSTPYAVKMTVAGAVTYIGKALPGTLQATAAWQCQKVDETVGTIITWADGNATFDNVATDLTALSYS